MNAVLSLLLKALQYSDRKKILADARFHPEAQSPSLSLRNEDHLSVDALTWFQLQDMPRILQLLAKRMDQVSLIAADHIRALANGLIITDTKLESVRLSSVSGMLHGKALSWDLSGCSNLEDVGAKALALHPGLSSVPRPQRVLDVCNQHIGLELKGRPISMVHYDWAGQTYLSTVGTNTHLAALACLDPDLVVDAMVTKHKVNRQALRLLADAGVSIWVSECRFFALHLGNLYNQTSGRVSDESLGVAQDVALPGVFSSGAGCLIALDHRAGYADVVAEIMRNGVAAGACRRLDFIGNRLSLIG